MLPVHRRLYELQPLSHHALREEQRGVHIAAVIGLCWGEPWAGVRLQGDAEIQQLVKASLKRVLIRVPTVVGLRSVVICQYCQTLYVLVVIVSYCLTKKTEQL